MSKDVTSYFFFKTLKSYPFIDEIYLFGSRAKGIGQERADIDLAIVCPTVTDEEWEQILNVIDEADTLLDIDCVRFDRNTNKNLREAILKNHTVLYTREENS